MFFVCHSAGAAVFVECGLCGVVTGVLMSVSGRCAPGPPYLRWPVHCPAAPPRQCADSDDASLFLLAVCTAKESTSLEIASSQAHNSRNVLITTE